MSGRSGSIRVLHVEDEPDFAEITAAYLEKQDDRFTVETASNPSDGLDRLTESQYDCIVSDYDMPGMDGIEFLRTVRQDYPNVPFILFTGKGSEEVASEAISAGVTDYLQKGGPERFEILANRCMNAVEQHRASLRVERTERRYGRLIEATNDVILIVNDDGTFEYLSPAAKSVLRHEPDALLGENGFDYIHPDDMDEVMALFSEMVEDPSCRPRVDFRFEQPDGSWTWIEVEGRNLIDDPVIGGHVVYAREVTERKERERELERTKERIEFALGATDSYIYEIDLETGREIRHGDFEEIYGVPAAAVPTSQAFYDRVVHPDDRDDLERFQQEVLPNAPGESHTIEYRTDPDLGEIKWVYSEMQLIERDRGNRVIGLATDDTARKKGGQALAEERNRFEALANGVPDVIYRADPETLEPEWVNDSVEAVFGYSREEWIENPDLWRQCIHPENENEVLSTLQELKEQQADGAQEYRIRTAEGQTKWLRDRFRWVRDNEGHVQSLLGVERDVTDRKDRERELRQYQRRYEAIFNNPVSFMALLEVDGTVIEVNEEALSFADTTNDIVRDTPFWDTSWWSHSEALQGELRSWLASAAHGELVRFEADHYGPDGDRVTIDGVVHPILDQDGEVTELVAAGRDITERKEREQELRRERNRLEAITEAIPDLIIVYDRAARFQDVLARQERLLVEDPDEQIGAKVDEVLPPDAAKAITDAIEAAIESRDIVTVEYRIELNGQPTWFEGRIAPLSDGETDQVILAARDVTERVEHERALARQRERLEEFASVLSHDLRNPLNVADGRLELARETGDSEHLEYVERAHDRMNGLIENLLTLARTGERIGEREAIALAEMARICWEMVAKNESTLLVTDDFSMSVQGDPERLRQVFENLYRNAIEHNADAVTITVGQLSSGEGLFIEDDGEGIPEDIRDQVFELGFSSNPDGNGIGLAIVREIIRSHGWEITVSESTNGGARFEIAGMTGVDN